MDRVSSLNLTRTLQTINILNFKPLRKNPMSYRTFMSYIRVLSCLIYKYSYVLYKTTITLCFEGLFSAATVARPLKG